jgi:hypothetical protein
VLEGKWENMFIAFPWVRAAKFHDMNYEYEKFIINNNIGETGAFLAIFVKVNFRSNYVRI